MQKSKKILLGKGGGMSLRKIVRIGDSVGLCLPKEFLYSKNLVLGDEVALVWNGGLKLLPLKENNERVNRAHEDY